MSDAALLIDLQVDFFANPRLTGHRPSLAANLNASTAMLREAGISVVSVTQVWAPDLHDAPRNVRDAGIRIVIDGTPGAALLPELVESPADLQVVKKRYSPLTNAQLQTELAARHWWPPATRAATGSAGQAATVAVGR